MIDFKRSTALYGGSFDPVHEGHLHVAREVMRQVPQLEQFVFVPAGIRPGKDAIASGELRAKWLEYACRPEGFLVWRHEVEKATPAYTVETLEAAHRAGASRQSLYWIVGADAYEELPTWREAGRIRELAGIIAVNRPGSELKRQDASDTLLSIPPHPASSRDLRAMLEAGEWPAPYLPGPVRDDMEQRFQLKNNPYLRKMNKWTKEN
jgi:nicotinate-nucleotide adenylyltransferase